jgi:hypothetical protein
LSPGIALIMTFVDRVSTAPRLDPHPNLSKQREL